MLQNLSSAAVVIGALRVNPLYTYKFFHLVLALCTYRRAQIIITKLRCYLVPEDRFRLSSISKVVVLLLLICCLLLLSLIIEVLCLIPALLCRT